MHKKKKKQWIRLVLTKSLNDPWPREFGGRSKWDLNLLKPWKNLDGHGSLNQHLEAQFDCHLLQSILNSSSKSPLNEVREILQIIFCRHHYDSMYLFAIYGQNNLDKDPVFHLRIIPPVRFSPQGSPLLIVAALDYQLVQLLKTQGKLEPERMQSDFHRIFTEGVSREHCIIHASSAKVTDLLRFLLRVNSTKMRRSAWQSKNLPRGEDSPWIPTFVSPLYAQHISNQCPSFNQEPVKCKFCSLLYFLLKIFLFLKIIY